MVKPVRVAVSVQESGVVGRAREMSEIESVLAAVDALPAGLALVGEPGIGKTTLWERAVDSASSLGYICLRSRLAEPEEDLAFTALGDLFTDAFPSVAPSLPEPQRRALGAALLMTDHGRVATDPRIVGVAVLSMLRALAARQPVLVAIDDAQWIDKASAGALGFAFRRLTGERVAVVTALRVGAAADEVQSVLRMRPQTTSIGITGLSLGALHAVVVAQFDHVLPRPQLRRLHELSRGNPFLAIELVRAAESGRLQLDAPGPAGTDLDRLLGARLEGLPLATRRLLLVTSAASRPTLQLLEAFGRANARRTLQPAVAAGIIEVVDPEVRFTHPLLASAAYGAPTDDERRGVHARLAELVADTEERARHLALAASHADETVAAAVERAAEAVFRRGAPAAAAHLATMAARLTPEAHREEYRRRAAAQAGYQFEAGDTASAAGVLEDLIGDAPPGNERARLLALLARIRHFRDDLEAGVELNLKALSQTRGDDALAASIHEGLAWGMLMTRANLNDAAGHARSAVRAAERAKSDVALSEALAARAVTALAIGAPAGRAMDRAIQLEPALMDLRVLRHPSYAKAYLLTCTDQLTDARVLCLELVARAEAHDDESALPSTYVQLSMAELLAGAWELAHSHAEIGTALAEQSGQRPSQAALVSRLALLAALRGQLDTAESLGARALRLSGATDNTQAEIERVFTRGSEIGTWALGATALARGHHRDALRYLSPMAGVLLAAGMREPGELRFLPDLVEALLGVERPDEADELVTEMEAMAAAAARSTARGIAARCRALVEVSRGRSGSALASAEASVRLLEGGPLPMEEGRARLVLGEIQRRSQQRRAARETLGSAIEAFNALGAAGWAARARAEMSRIGGRTSSPDQLTPTEKWVAELVAQGMANKEVGAALGVATKTVELHLSRVYAKLDLGSRTELVRHITTKGK